MKQEEKARAYDKALAKAKEQYNYPCMRSCMGILEEIFPELKESEDEKMRKELIRAFKSLNTIKVWNGIERNDILAWLEKQAEQKAYPKTLDEAIDLYYFSYGNNKGGFDNLSLEKFRDIVKTFVENYGNKKA